MGKVIKYGIEKIVYEISGNVKEILDNLLNEDPYEDMTYTQNNILVDDRDEAEKEFADLMSRVEMDSDDQCYVERFLFESGEAEIDKYVLEDAGEEVYTLTSYEVERVAPFDEESLSVIESLGIEIKDDEILCGHVEVTQQ